MIGIRQAINQLPSWPGFALALLVVLALGGWYYGTSYATCMEVRDGRNELQQAISQAASRDQAVFDMARDLPGDWDEVRIVQAYNPGRTPLNCPFGWDMTWRERQALIEAGKYTVVGLFRDGEFRRYIEYNADLGSFKDAPDSLARNQARFLVEGDKAPYSLTPVR